MSRNVCDLKHNFAVWQGYALIGRDYIAGPRELGFLPLEPEGLSCFTDCAGDGLPFAATPRWEAIDDFVDGRIEAQPLELGSNIADIKRQFFSPLRCHRRNPLTIVLRNSLSHGGKVLVHEEYRYAKALADI